MEMLTILDMIQMILDGDIEYEKLYDNKYRLQLARKYEMKPSHLNNKLDMLCDQVRSLARRIAEKKQADAGDAEFVEALETINRRLKK